MPSFSRQVYVVLHRFSLCCVFKIQRHSFFIFFYTYVSSDLGKIKLDLKYIQAPEEAEFERHVVQPVTPVYFRPNPYYCFQFSSYICALSSYIELKLNLHHPRSDFHHLPCGFFFFIVDPHHSLHLVLYVWLICCLTKITAVPVLQATHTPELAPLPRAATNSVSKWEACSYTG